MKVTARKRAGASSVVLALMCLVSTLGLTEVAAQIVRGGTVKPSASVIRPAEADLSYARVMPAEEFSRLDLATRRRVMKAWANASPEKAGVGILPLLEAGLRDDDREVLGEALWAEQHLQSAAGLARLAKRPIQADPLEYRPLVDRVWELIDHPNLDIRRRGVLLLATLEMPPSAAVETALLARLPREQPSVRAQMIGALIGRATESVQARQAVLSAFDDESVEVQSQGVYAMRMLHLPEGIPKLQRIIEGARESFRRVNAVAALESYGTGVVSSLPFIRGRLTVEADATVKAALEHFLANPEMRR